MGLTTLETRRIKADMIEVYTILNGLEGNENGSMFIKSVDISRGHSQKLFKKRVRMWGNILSATEFVMSGIVCREI